MYINFTKIGKKKQRKHVIKRIFSENDMQRRGLTTICN